MLQVTKDSRMQHKKPDSLQIQVMQVVNNAYIIHTQRKVHTNVISSGNESGRPEDDCVIFVCLMHSGSVKLVVHMPRVPEHWLQMHSNVIYICNIFHDKFYMKNISKSLIPYIGIHTM
jgi:hypothetical protein